MTKTAKFISVEGIEGVGKSTTVAFMQQCLQDHGVPFVLTREPGGTPIAEKVRDLLLAHHEETMDIKTELLLFFAGRAQHIAQVIKPALAGGEWVLCDRFTDTSYAYQGGGRGVPEADIAILEQWVQADLRPDVTILLDAPVEVAFGRAKNRGELDRIEVEDKAFFEKIRKAYLARAEKHAERYHIVDASQTLDKVQADLAVIIQSLVEA